VLVPIVPGVAEGRGGHASSPVQVVGRVDLVDVGCILGMGGGGVGGDGGVEELGVAVVLGDDGERRVLGGGWVDEVGGETEGLTCVCATGVDDEVGAVAEWTGVSKRVSECSSECSECVSEMGPARLGARSGAAAGQGEKKREKEGSCDGSENELASCDCDCDYDYDCNCGVQDHKEGATHCCWRLSLREHLISQPG
jgi:hypothetical protein